jgi:hypothetical protein
MVEPTPSAGIPEGLGQRQGSILGHDLIQGVPRQEASSGIASAMQPLHEGPAKDTGAKDLL